MDDGVNATDGVEVDSVVDDVGKDPAVSAELLGSAVSIRL